MEEKNAIKNDSNKGLNIVVILLIFVIIGMVVYMLYDKGLLNKFTDNQKEENNTSEEVETAKEEELDVNGSLVQQLYRNIMTYDLVSIDILNSIRENGFIKASDITSEQKNYFAYRQVAISDIKSDLCSNYENLFSQNENLRYGCSGEYYVGMPSYTSTSYIQEDILKQSVEKIFGKDSYQRVDYFPIALSAGYVYDQATSRYVLGSYPGGGTGPIPTFTLVSAKKIGDEIKIIENAKLEQDGYLDESMLFNVNIEYTFKLEDNNYIFVSANVIS